MQKEKTYFAITAWKCLKRLKKVEQYLYCSIFPAHIIRWRHKKYLNHCHRRKKEGSSLKKTLICIKKCLLLFWMRKKFVIIQKTILSSNSRRCTIQITFIYIPGYCDILKTEKNGEVSTGKACAIFGCIKNTQKILCKLCLC